MIANPYESISAQAEKMLRQELTSSELVEQCCERIEALDSRLGAFQLLCLERARVAGQAVDQAIESGHRIETDVFFIGILHMVIDDNS